MSENKDTSVIPAGSYCYTILDIVPDDKTGIRVKTKLCPYFTTKNYGEVKQPYCAFLEKGGLNNSTSDEEFKKLVAHFGSEEAVFNGLPLSLLWDQVKECGENDNDEGLYNE